MEQRFLIVNADDFGLSSRINRGIVRAHREGIVTSTSLMVRWPAAREASQLAAAHPELSVGLHLDLGEWEQNGVDWRPVYEVLADPGDARMIRREAASQLQQFRRLIGRDPTHLDSHQHVHLDGPARHALWAVGRRIGIPVRHLDPRVTYCGSFYGIGDTGTPEPSRLAPAALLELLRTLPAGTTELCTHPGEAGERSRYGEQRAYELTTLSDPAVRAHIDTLGIKLISFAPEPPHPLAPASSSAVKSSWRERWRRFCSIPARGPGRAERRSACGPL